MKLGTNFPHTAVAGAALVLCAAAYGAEPALTIECLNPPMKRIQFTQVARGEASSQPIQFQINQGNAKPESTINVDANNKGICRVSISDGYVIKSGDYFSSLTGMYNASDKSKPEEIDKIVQVSFRKSGVRNGEFIVSASKDSPRGSATLTLMVKYAKDD